MFSGKMYLPAYQLVYWHVICDASNAMKYDSSTPELVT